MLSTFAAALRTDPDLKPLLPTDPSPTAFDLLHVLATKPFPVSLAPSSVREAEGLADTAFVALYRIHYLPSRLTEFPKRNHNNQLVDPKPDSITNLAIHAHIKDDAPLIQELEALATLPAIIDLVKDFPRFFTSYCTLSIIQLKPLALAAPLPSSSLSRCLVSWLTLEKLRPVTL